MSTNASAATTTRKGSAEKAIPHTRIADDAMIKDNYDVGQKIGQGNFGKVYAATHRSTGVVWAIKSINKEKAGSSALKLVEREVAILKRVNHPNIILLNEVIESPKRMYLVMEMCTEGELADRLQQNKLFSEGETKKIMIKLTSAISYLHKHGIVHRDLKLENILMAVNPDDPADKLHIKVTDFGLSVVKGGVSPDSMMQDFCGTPIYMAPEILDNKTYSQQCDVWALGIIMYTLICGNAPFLAKDEAALYDLIREANVQFDAEIWKAVSEQCKNCILGMLKVDPAHRLSAAEVLNHPWITGQERDTTQPTNVLEMMKMWKDELRHDSTGNETEGNFSADSGSAFSDSSERRRNSSKSPPAKTQSDSENNSPKQSDSKESGVKRIADSKSPSSSTTSQVPKSSVSKKSTGTNLSVPRISSRSTTPNTGNGQSKTPSPVSPIASKSSSSTSKSKKK